MSPNASRVWDLVEARIKGVTRTTTVPGFVIKHIDTVTEACSADALNKFPGDTHEARCERLAYYYEQFLDTIADHMRPKAAKEFIQLMACYLRNAGPQSYTIDGSGCYNPAA